MKVVTTVHKAGFDQYGERFLQGMSHWPEHEFIMYSEGFTPPCAHKDVANVERLEAFKRPFTRYIPPRWEWDVVRFSNKVFAAYDALYSYEGLGVWLDCDAVTYADIPAGYIESLLPSGAYIAMFKRRGYHSETGFWIVDCAHQHHKPFMDAWIAMYETGAFKALPQWHDCEMLDFTVHRFERDGLIKSHSLSGEHDKDMHPMAKADLGRYIDHCKGRRKDLGRSPENTYRNAA